MERERSGWGEMLLAFCKVMDEEARKEGIPCTVSLDEVAAMVEGVRVCLKDPIQGPQMRVTMRNALANFHQTLAKVNKGMGLISDNILCMYDLETLYADLASHAEGGDHAQTH